MSTDTEPKSRPAHAADADTLKRVFVVGFPRSGTTWAMYLLAEHPGVVGAQQVGLFHALEPLERWWHNTRGWGRRVIVGSGTTDADGTPINHRKLPDTLGSDEYYAIARSIADGVYRKMAAVQPGTLAVVDQTAENIDFARLILRMFPDSYFLHIVRDPRAVYASWRKAVKSWAKENEFTGSAVQIARRWCAYDALGLELATLTDRYRHVRYEDLLVGGGDGVADLFRWLDLPCDPEVAQKAFDECAIDKMRQKVEAPKGFIRKGSAEGWRDEISSGDIRLLEYLAREPMQRLGYECVTRAGSKPLRLRAHDGMAKTVGAAKGVLGPELQRRLRSMLKSG